MKRGRSDDVFGYRPVDTDTPLSMCSVGERGRGSKVGSGGIERRGERIERSLTEQDQTEITAVRECSRRSSRRGAQIVRSEVLLLSTRSFPCFCLLFCSSFFLELVLEEEHPPTSIDVFDLFSHHAHSLRTVHSPHPSFRLMHTLFTDFSTITDRTDPLPAPPDWNTSIEGCLSPRYQLHYLLSPLQRTSSVVHSHP